MRTILVAALTAVAVAISGVVVATPAQATRGDSRACVTAKEYRAIKNGMSEKRAIRILDGKGWWGGDSTLVYSKCNKRGTSVWVLFAEPFDLDTGESPAGNTVFAKRIIKSEYRSTMSRAEYNKIKPGMTVKRVSTIIGGQGHLVTWDRAPKGKTEMVRTWAKVCSHEAFAWVSFRNGKVRKNVSDPLLAGRYKHWKDWC